MEHLPSIELLNSTHQFPTDYVFKVIGNAGDAFLGRALVAARTAAGLEKDPQFSVRQSIGGRHVAVTLLIPAPNAEKVLEIYQALSKIEGLALLM